MSDKPNSISVASKAFFLLGLMIGVFVAGIVSHIWYRVDVRSDFSPITNLPKETRANVVYVVPKAEVGRTIAARVDAGEIYMHATPLWDVVDDWPNRREESDDPLQPQLLFFRAEAAPWNRTRIEK